MNSCPIVVVVSNVFALFAFLSLEHEPSRLRTHGVCLNHTLLSSLSTRSTLDPNGAGHHLRVELVTVVIHLYRNSCPTWRHIVGVDFVVADPIQDEIWEWVPHKYFAVVFARPVFTPEAESGDPAVVERRTASLVMLRHHSLPEFNNLGRCRVVKGSDKARNDGLEQVMELSGFLAPRLDLLQPR